MGNHPTLLQQSLSFEPPKRSFWKSLIIFHQMCVCEDQYLFLGSRLGNSLLLHYTEKELSDPMRSKGNVSADQEPPVKRSRLDTLGE